MQRIAVCGVLQKQYPPPVNLKFPDANFRTVLTSQCGMVETNGDIDPANTTNATRIANLTFLDISNKNVASLKGIEYLTALTTLYCYNNPLAPTFDISKNVALKELRCYSANLSTLDISKNTALQSLNCSKNYLTTLDLSSKKELTALGCASNALTTLNITANTTLQYMYCSNNNLTALDVSKNTMLEKLDCNSNQLATLDLSNNIKLQQLACERNNITKLDIRKLNLKEEIYSFSCGDQKNNIELELTLYLPQKAAWERTWSKGFFNERVTLKY